MIFLFLPFHVVQFGSVTSLTRPNDKLHHIKKYFSTLPARGRRQDWAINIIFCRQFILKILTNSRVMPGMLMITPTSVKERRFLWSSSRKYNKKLKPFKSKNRLQSVPTEANSVRRTPIICICYKVYFSAQKLY